MAKKKSAFVMSGESNKDIIREASKTTRTNILDNGQIIEALNLQNGKTVSLICKVAKISADVFTTDPTDPKYNEKRAGAPYVNFQFIPVSGPLKGGMIGNFMGCYDRETYQIDAKAMEWVFREFQGLDFDTNGWTLADVEEAAEEITDASDKPVVSLVVKCNTIKSGKNKGDLGVNFKIGRLLEDVIEDDDDDDDEPEVEAEVEEEEAEEPEVAEEPVKATRGRAKKVVEPSFSIGDKVSYNFEDEVLECTVVKVNAKAKTCDITDAEYDYEGVKFSELEAI